MRNSSFAFLLLSLWTLSALHAQNAIPRWDSVRVLESNILLRNPAAGGFNIPEFSPIDLDQDGTQDLFVFDRSGKKVITFLNRGTAGQVDYDFAPEYVSAFPAGITDFALLRDFNCDGKADLFFGTSNGIKVYENTSVSGNLSFQLFRDTLLTDLGAGPAVAYLYQGDLPDFVDVDGDSDLDMLTFNQFGTVVEWHKNLAVENTGNCNGLELIRADACWGNFQESGLNQTITLGINCRVAPGQTQPVKPSAHSGSTIAAFDEDADGDYELVIGDLTYDGLTYLHNAGTNVDAEMDSIDATFPSYAASVQLDVFAAAFFMDANNDGKKDMLVGANNPNVSVNYDNSWYYQNIAPGNGVVLERVTRNFLTSEMIDAGLCAFPVLFDHNADGLMDLVVGNYSRKITASNVNSGLVLYENTGTANSPEFRLTSRNYAALTNAFNPAILGMTPAFGDMDGDGDQDLMIGDADGKLHYVQNTAPSGQVANFPNVTVQYFNIDIGQFATPSLADIDRDGDLDLIVGEITGNLNFFENTGTAQVAVFSNIPNTETWGNVDTEPICCTGFSVPFIFENPQTNRFDMIVGSEKGDLFYYKDFESELGGTFTLDQGNFGEMKEGQRTAIVGGDLNGDNVWEWMVGNVRGGIGFYSGNGLVSTDADPLVPMTSDWSVFPNPSANLFNIKVEQHLANGTMSISLLNLQGQELLAQTNLAAAKGTTLDLSSFAPGIYFLRMELNGVFGGVKRIEVMR